MQRTGVRPASMQCKLLIAFTQALGRLPDHPGCRVCLASMHAWRNKCA